MSKRKKHPGYKELVSRYRAQADHIARLHGHYYDREAVLTARQSHIATTGGLLQHEAARLAAERRELDQRGTWGFWRRVRFAVTGK